MNLKLPEPSLRFVDRRNADLTAAWSLRWGNFRLEAKAGARTDGASTPWFIWWIPGFSPFEGDTMPGAFAHDLFYATKLVPRKTADELLLVLLLLNGVPFTRAVLYFIFVRAFGWHAWRNHDADSVERSRQYVRFIPG